jgi:hypothetical protein
MPLYKLNLFCNIKFSNYNCGIVVCLSYKLYVCRICQRQIVEGDQNVSVHLTITVQCNRKIPTQLMIWRWPSQNSFGMWTVLYWTQSVLYCTQSVLYWTRSVLYWTRSSRTQFGVSINVWRLGGGTLWTLLVTFSTVIIRCTMTFCSPCIRLCVFACWWRLVRPLWSVVSQEHVSNILWEKIWMQAATYPLFLVR